MASAVIHPFSPSVCIGYLKEDAAFGSTSTVITAGGPLFIGAHGQQPIIQGKLSASNSYTKCRPSPPITTNRYHRLLCPLVSFPPRAECLGGIHLPLLERGFVDNH